MKKQSKLPQGFCKVKVISKIWYYKKLRQDRPSNSDQIRPVKMSKTKF